MPTERIQRQIDRLLDEADEAIASQDWTTVGNRARSALRLDPENLQALLSARIDRLEDDARRTL